MQAMAQVMIISVIVAGLVFGSTFFIPIAIALLIATLIGAAADRLRRRGLSETVATCIASLFFIASFLTALYAIFPQIDEVTAAWPRYVERFQALMSNASEWLGPHIASKIAAALGHLDLARTVPGLIGSAGAFLANLILVALYTGFLLAERGTVSGKVVNLFSSDEELAQATAALNEIVSGIREYVWIKTIMSVLTALVSYAVLKTIGVDFSETWALLIFFLNFIPNIGSIVGVVFPALLALIQFDGLWQFFTIAIILSGAQFVIGNVIEPKIMGRTLNLSPFVVMASLAFWSMVWGIVGAFMSVPLTAAVAIACSKLPNWRWLAVLLSEDGEIDTAARAAQRAS